jgi:hypothetical protein
VREYRARGRILIAALSVTTRADGTFSSKINSTLLPNSGGFFAIFLHLVGPVTAGAGRSTARLRRG